jgi:hypothetical protein
MEDNEKDMPTREFLFRQYPMDFWAVEPIWQNGLQCDFTPSGEQPCHPWSEVSGENINSTPAQVPEEIKIQM